MQLARRRPWLPLAILVLLSSCDSIVDEFGEGDEDSWYVEAGRYEGAWKFAGDVEELREFATGLLRIEFRIEEPLPGSWVGKKPPKGTRFFSAAQAAASFGHGILAADGREVPYHMFQAPTSGDWWGSGMLIRFDEAVLPLSDRAYGDEFGISLEAKRNPANDWLYLWLGKNSDGSAWGLPYTRSGDER